MGVRRKSKNAIPIAATALAFALAACGAARNPNIPRWVKEGVEAAKAGVHEAGSAEAAAARAQRERGGGQFGERVRGVAKDGGQYVLDNRDNLLGSSASSGNAVLPQPSPLP